MTLLDTIIRKIAEFLVILQMFLMASCWPTPLDEDHEGTEQEEEQRNESGESLRRRQQLGPAMG